MASDGPRGPDAATGGSCATATARSQRVVETKGEGDSTQAEREIREVNTGIFVFDAGALREALPRLSAENAQGELYLPQVLDLLRADGAAVAAHVVEDERSVLGVNDRAALARVRALAQAAIHERHMRAGVGIVDPHATVIDVDVEIGQDTMIEPFTTIAGTTRIGADCTVRHSYLARLRARGRRERRAVRLPAPGNRAARGREGRDVRGGQELRHRRRRENPASLLHRRRGRRRGDEPRRGDDHRQLRRPRQAPHDVGQRRAHGVDTTLVAPVAVGDDAYTAAGSVITEDVPAGALGDRARAPAANIEGYAERGERSG